MKAIETIYKGHRFRSRLEARYAVVFDMLGIEWQYEPQGFECGQRLTKSLWWADYPRINYLPDFWLPREKVFVEVKGQFPERADLTRFLDCAAYLALGDEQFGCTEDIPSARPVVLLGPGVRTGWRLDMFKGSMYATPWWPRMSRADRAALWQMEESRFIVDDGTDTNDQVFCGTCSDAVSSALLAGPLRDLVTSATREAFDAGRMARFEHGETHPARFLLG